MRKVKCTKHPVGSPRVVAKPLSDLGSKADSVCKYEVLLACAEARNYSFLLWGIYHLTVYPTETSHQEELTLPPLLYAINQLGSMAGMVACMLHSEDLI